MFEWIFNNMAEFGSVLGKSAEEINNKAEMINSHEFVMTAPFMQYIGAIHYVVGDVIWYQCMFLLVVGFTVVLFRLIMAIIRIIRDLKQTALF